MKTRSLFCVLFLFCFSITAMFSQQHAPVRLGIAGLSHSHVHLLLKDLKRTDIQIVGIAESNRELAERYAKNYGFDPAIVYDSIEKMVEKTKPEGVLGFNSIYDHLQIVEVCAPKGIHVMVEKPLAVSVEHAARMAELSRKYGTMVLTNYETTWYPSNHKAFDMVINQKAIGDIRKVIICDGHRGPKEINVNHEFLVWLTDPKLNGGGAVIDFGCYGANLMTWLMNNQRPIAVSATLQQIKPDVYPKVDDEATIVVTYPKAQAIIQASWNWPVDRKDMEVYGVSGYVKALTGTDFSYRLTRESPESIERLQPLPAPENEPFGYFAKAIKGELKVADSDLSSLANNLIVVEILEAARNSAAAGKTIKLPARL